MERLSHAEIEVAIKNARESMEDMEQVKRDLYDNFTSMTKLLIACICAYGFKRGKEINSTYLKILRDLEFLLCDTKHDPRICCNINENLYPHLRQELSTVLSDSRELRTSCYMLDVVDSMLELARSNNFFKVDDLADTDILLIKFLQFSKEYWLTNDNHENLRELFICVEAVLHTITGRWWDAHNNHCKNLYICKAILKVLVMLVEPEISTPTLSDELLISYVHCIQLILKDENINNLMDPTKHGQLMIINGDVGVLITVQPQENTTSSHLVMPIQLQAILWNIGSLIYSVLNNGKMATKRNLLQLPDLIEKHCAIRQFLSTIIIKRLMQASPHTDPFGFMNFLTGDMKELISCNLDTIFFWKDHFQEIHKALVFFSSFLEKTPHSNTTRGASQALSMRIRNAAYMAEYLIDSFLVGAFYVTDRLSIISFLSEEIKLINTSILDSIANTVTATNMGNIDASSPILVAEATNSVQTVDVVVGFDKEIKVIMGQLITNSKERDVVSITGMPGLGKTTLARKVFDHPYIVNHFQYRAWCCVSQEYHKRELLLAILGYIIKINTEILKKSDEDLCVTLHKELMERRYLIVMDNIWVKDAFEELQLFFPENRNGSRLMLTSRDKSVGDLAKYHLELGLLTEELSWDLLEQKVYPKEKCPRELCQVGKDIAKKCNGLPLAVVVVGGLLATSEKKLDFWKQVAGNLFIALGTQLHAMSALDLSYNLLPDYLKPLFLYIGAFPEDENISVKILKCLWVAEGFVHKANGNMRLEDEAEIKLMELTNRNLLMVAERRYDGRIKSVRIHDLLREMSIRKAEEEMFLHQINVHSGGASLPDPFYSFYRVSIYPSKKYTPIHSGVTYDDLQILSMNSQMQSLLSFDSAYPSEKYTPIHSGVTYDDLQRLSMTSPMHSILSFDSSRSFYQDSFFHNCKLLRVLYFATNSYINLLSDIMLLVRLRYISIITCDRKIPSSISRLINLETLIIKGGEKEYAREIEVPVEIWEMVKLRHIHITPSARFLYAPENSSKLENLQTLSTVFVYYAEGKNVIKRSPNVRELKCQFRLHWNSDQHYLQLESLDQLEALKLCSSYDDYTKGSLKYFGYLGVLSTLKKLTLTMFHLQWSQISAFRNNLPNLEFLKLFRAVDGELWELGEDDVFPKLKVLIFEWLKIKQWIASAENFPCLQKLVIHLCLRLEEIPSGIGEIDSLLEIELMWCSYSVKNSAREIQEYQKGFGNESLIIRIIEKPNYL